MADSTDKLLRDYFSGRLKLMAEIDPKHKQAIVDITFCLSVIKPEHSEVIKRYYSDKFITWDEIVSEVGKSNPAIRVWRTNFKTLLNIILQHGDEFINLRQEALRA
ncbi:hypothetical protein [Leuconostoc citreum]|uniref:hypothetical protein n=1 Tax=Leuconostoc citreum TaxID=33964 RepID=UPI001FBB63DB|nr:hypothetical protein [Leuconostoc citreum]MCJ2167403.1 hypothetical protein [Leuconostoc citreum]MCQ6658624.1 hypothetical protein [Leuconostoc citreum]